MELDLHAEGFGCPILRTVATEGQGIAELVEAIDAAGTVARPQTATVGPTIDHLGIAVRSLEQALEFYEALGLAVAIARP